MARRALALLLCGCGALAPPDAADGSIADAATEAIDVDAAGCFVCPEALPAPGTACLSLPDASEGCEYGDFTTGDCSSIATCTDAGWTLDVPPSPQCANAVGCPAAFDGPAPSCTLGLRCDYARGRCGCEEGDGGLAWTCATTNDPSCPPARPRIGSSCQGSHSCGYGDPNGCSPLVGIIVECDPCGTWQRAPVFAPPCPH